MPAENIEGKQAHGNVPPPQVSRELIAKIFTVLFANARADGNVSLRSFLDNAESTPFGLSVVSLSRGVEAVIDAAYREACRCASEPEPIVFCPPLCTVKGRRAREIDVIQGMALSVECDKCSSQARGNLETLLGPATIVVQSGGTWLNPETGEIEDKLHLHWRPREPAEGTNLTRLKHARDLATRLVGGDPTNKPVVHPIRWPGSIHRKNVMAALGRDCRHR